MIRRIVAGTAFAVPVVASFDMASLSVSTADAYAPNQFGGPPTISSAGATTFVVGKAGSFTITTTTEPDSAATSLEETGALPAGVTFTDNGNGSATIAGTPATGTGAVYDLAITASNSFPPTATQQFVLTVQEAPAFTSGSSASLSTGAPGSFMIEASGYPQPTISQSGRLPAGVGFKAGAANGTAILAGEPAASAKGVYALTLTASNGVGSAASQQLALTVDEAPAFTNRTAATFKVGHSETFEISVAGYPAPTIKLTGRVPKGLKFKASADGRATISGKPSKGSQGRYELKLTASAPGLTSASQKLTLTVLAAPKKSSHG